MIRINSTKSNLARFARILVVLAIVCGYSLTSLSAPVDPLRFYTGLRNGSGSRGLTSKQLRVVLESLRHKTGFLEMHFDQSGFLMLGDRGRFSGGSAAARELLIATVDGRGAFELENHDNSPRIAFANLTAGTIVTSFQTKVWVEVRYVQLDFADFGELRGDREVVAAFDPGFAVLHELAHGVWGLHDAVGKTTELGACDQQINRMRRELNLPERQGYSPRILTGILIQTAELVFARDRAKPGRLVTDRFYLRWPVKRVSDYALSN
jgi:hypothetical protein